MSTRLSPHDFPAFYAALHGGREPFPWQRMLAERVAETGWPEGIDLPTASGKTACLDVAVFSLACQANRPASERTTPRRIFYIVDRRIIVDAAHEHATAMANALASAESGILAEVAAALRRLQHDDLAEPLYSARLRGGAVRDDGWAHSPAQAAVVSGTVDQIGSRLLFRGFGPGQLTASIHAGLIANDSLLLLDEAHCAVPFLQTTRSVAAYRDSVAEPLAQGPFTTTVMSATPPDTIAPEALFPAAAEREAALDHPALNQRLQTNKPAALVQCKKTPKDATPADDPLVHEACRRAETAVHNGQKRIAIMVNRVATARACERRLLSRLAEHDTPPFDTALLTGRMRGLDRDHLLEQWQPVLRADAPTDPDRPVILVTTQCLEVGADFSFDTLVTECASLDALRQRFGRLNRLGNAAATDATILIRTDQAKNSDDDPIYGPSLAATWHWLAANAESGPTKKAPTTVDFGALTLDRTLANDPAGRQQRERALAAPTKDAPVMLPSHLDAFVQTAPRPVPDPDVSVFLHGPDSSAPEVNLAFRADIGDTHYGDPEAAEWLEPLTWLPPTSRETISVPLWLMKRLLSEANAPDADIPDVEGASEPTADRRRLKTRSQCPVVVWRGRNDSAVTRNLNAIQPNDTIVLPSGALPHVVDAVLDRPTDAPIDIRDAVSATEGQSVALRIHPQTLAPWSSDPAINALLAWATTPHRDESPEDLTSRLGTVADRTMLPAWLRDTARALSRTVPRIIEHPQTGYILLPPRGSQGAHHDAGADADDLTSQAGSTLTLKEHLAQVEEAARRFAQPCLPPTLRDTVTVAGWLHDIGKADPRFQTMLHGGNEFARFRHPAPLAKGTTIPTSQRARRRARELSGLPDRFRHEMLSAQLVEQQPKCIPDHCDGDLVRHLIASHHGYARPFAPVCDDPKPVAVGFEADHGDCTWSFALTADERAALKPPHRLDSDVSDRFWRLTRRYGWWGLAYLEAMVRLADWRASTEAQTPRAQAPVQEQELNQ